MIRGAVDGRIDFSKADPRDSRWYIGLMWRLSEIDRTEKLELLRLRHTRQLAYVMCPHLKPESMRGIFDSEAELAASITGLVLGSGDTPADRRAEMAARLSKAWESAFGDASDPAVKQAIETTATALDAMSASKR